MTKQRIGFLVNPIAGMGGKVGLKGTDSDEVLRQARELGAEQRSPDRAKKALHVVSGYADSLELLTGPKPMGENVAEECGFSPRAIGSIDGSETTAADTRRIAGSMVDRGIDLLLFAGGDGTARDVYSAVGETVPVIGIPAGVKIYSGVFCATPKAAGELLESFISDDIDSERRSEVMDIDEEAYRNDRLSGSLYGYLRVPQKRQLVQSPKSGSPADAEAAKESIGREIVDKMDAKTVYVLGPGTTTAAVMDELGIEPTLLGVDAVCGGEILETDLRESKLLDVVSDAAAEIVVGVIGGQGFVFGRGNQQISSQVVEAVGVDNVVVVATERKIHQLDGPLRVDTGDPEIDEALTGYTQVVTGRGTRSVVRVTR
jgi:predicted polyphosphate/ATP-dependent NAD kinase